MELSFLRNGYLKRSRCVEAAFRLVGIYAVVLIILQDSRMSTFVIAFSGYEHGA